MKSVLNVGGNSKDIPIPSYYNGWKHDLLDIDPKSNADIICDGRNLTSLEKDSYDAVFCSHNLEHYYPHETYQVLKGFLHVLKPEGFVEIRVPNILEVIKYVAKNEMDLNDVLYHSSEGPIQVNDVLYGWALEIEKSGQSFFAHKTGFSPFTLQNLLINSGFKYNLVLENKEFFEILSFSFKNKPTNDMIRMLDVNIPENFFN